MQEPQRQLPFPLAKLAELLIKARAEGVTLRPAPRSREVMEAVSAKSGNVYIVDGDRCTCPAGQRGRPCKHRALWISAHAGEYAEALLAASVGMIMDRERDVA
jgi:hypothetical protein